jgi:hypothetical protein
METEQTLDTRNSNVVNSQCNQAQGEEQTGGEIHLINLINVSDCLSGKHLSFCQKKLSAIFPETVKSIDESKAFSKGHFPH